MKNIQRFLSYEDNSSVLIAESFPDVFVSFNLTWYSSCKDTPQTITIDSAPVNEIDSKLYLLYEALGDYFEARRKDGLEVPEP